VTKCKKCGDIMTQAVKVDRSRGEKPHHIQYYCDRCGRIHSEMFRNEKVRDFVFKNHLAFVKDVNRCRAEAAANGTCSSIW
jgi:RNase P subunit RPR2